MIPLGLANAATVRVGRRVRARGARGPAARGRDRAACSRPRSRWSGRCVFWIWPRPLDRPLPRRGQPGAAGGARLRRAAAPGGGGLPDGRFAAGGGERAPARGAGHPGADADGAGQLLGHRAAGGAGRSASGPAGAGSASGSGWRSAWRWRRCCSTGGSSCATGSASCGPRRRGPDGAQPRARSTAPQAIIPTASHWLRDRCSPRKATPKTATSTTLSLSTGATRLASPSFNARK